MNTVKKGDVLSCVKYYGGVTRIYLADKYRLRKRVGNDDSFFVDISFSQSNSQAICKLIAECQGLHAVATGQGMGGSFLFEVVR